MPDDDVATTLSELERKLKDLEDELGAVSLGLPADAVPSAPAPTPTFAPVEEPPAVPAPVTAPAPPPQPSASPPAPAGPAAPPPAVAAPIAVPAPIPAAAAPTVVPGTAAATPLEAFVRFREAFERSARDIMVEFDELVRTVQEATAAARLEAPGSEPPAAGGPLDAVVLEGVVVVDAGPFPDVATLSAFEEALANVAEVRDSHVLSFDGSRAVVEVTLKGPVALGGALRQAARVALATTRAGSGRLSLVLGPPSAPAA